MPIAWHPSRWWDWCVLNDEKKRQKNCESNTQLFLKLSDTKITAPGYVLTLARPREILTAPMRMIKYILEVFWYIMWEILTAPKGMMNYILRSQEIYEQVVHNNPSKAIKKQNKNKKTP